MQPREFKLRQIGTCCALLALLLSASVSGVCQQTGQAEALISEFDHSRFFWQQLQAAQEIVALNDPAVLPHFEHYLTSEDRHLRGNAAFVLAGFGRERGLKIIFQILQDRSSPRAESEGGTSAPWAIAEQIKADRYYAVHLLSLLKNPQAVPVLVPFLKDRDINYEVAWALGEIGDRAAIRPLMNALSDPSPDMRVASIDALVQLNAKGAIPSLRLLLGDNERIHTGDARTVAESAKSAITKLSTSR